MEDIRQSSVAIFDEQFTNNHIRKLKVLLRLLEPPMQKSIAVYIKFMELQYTLQHPCPSQPVPFDNLCDELIPYCTAQEKQQFTQFRNLQQTMQNLQNMMEMLETMKELFPEGMGFGDGSGGFSPEMFSAMSSMFGGNMDFGAMAEMFTENTQ